MAWFLEGTGTQLGFSVSDSGKLNAYGTCSQRCRPQGGDVDIFRYVGGIQGLWSLHSSDAAEHEYDGIGRGLKAFFVRNEWRAAALIHYYEQDKQQPAAVGAFIVMPPSVAQETLSLLKTAFGNAQIRYVITLVRRRRVYALLVNDPRPDRSTASLSLPRPFCAGGPRPI